MGFMSYHYYKSVFERRELMISLMGLIGIVGLLAFIVIIGLVIFLVMKK